VKCIDVVLQQIVTTVPTEGVHDHYLPSCFVVSSDLELTNMLEVKEFSACVTVAQYIRIAFTAFT
jgi:hypothetical protein